ncbi:MULTISPECIES: RodZ family helix-turn-helix domain-containing protein [unclassified Cyanobium]|uniref:helix-turn-helix domain-containing protein n=1 Tax=unclassified Cyanobium TaxID=2627006 RepID=UPI0020CE282C|nr:MULTISPECIES: helix-turn-helix transcriptional regulator [unclassified Cyanobium]MCP9861346.1 helix-turn-helix domain-containing protein [Cyanobium sp. Cruz-8H5]MCP9867607.1 helix-turn-helix domain-containing protein [Cyanobium sp. Cruz-8D1]
MPKPAPSLFQRLRERLPGQRRRMGKVVEERRQDPLLLAGQQLREARESRGIGLRQLALDTRISTAVLEALERGWRDRLPEAAYLRTMLPLLEHHLELPAGCLDGVLPPEPDRRHGRRRDTVLLRFTPGSIDVFTTWQGTVLYAVLCAGLLYGLNLQQRHLAAQGLNALRPIPPLSAAQADQANLEDADRAILGAYPDLRPLGKAAAGQGLQRLRRETSQIRPDLALGLLRLELSKPTRVSLRSDRGVETQLPAAQGSLSLPVLPPFSLRLDPAPAAGSVRWNGQPLAPATPAAESPDPSSGQGQAQFLYPPLPAAAPSRPRP